jgi:hypothetical protein
MENSYCDHRNFDSVNQALNLPKVAQRNFVACEQALIMHDQKLRP